LAGPEFVERNGRGRRGSGLGGENARRQTGDGYTCAEANTDQP
jgi:hypothetical protein